MSKRFAIIGAAGYVAPRHMRAIKDTGNDLVAVLDPNDSVGILDSYAPGCLYFREPERFYRWLLKNPVDYISVCSPNYLHDSHCIMAMRAGADVICEKPLCLREKNIDSLKIVEEQTGKKVNVVLQCRLHEDAIKAKEMFFGPADAVLDPDDSVMVDVDYCTPRGPWYGYSWKGDVQKSGGLATNIGIHLFDLCVWMFGGLTGYCVADSYGPQTMDGNFKLEKAHVRWRLSTNGEKKRLFTVRSDEEYGINLVNGFDDLHTKTYEKVLSGDGFCVDEIRQATRIVEAIRAD